MKRALIWLGILALVALFAPACKPCVRGHNEQVLRQGYMVQDAPTVIEQRDWRGKRNRITIPHSHWVPAYQETVYVCDEFGK